MIEKLHGLRLARAAELVEAAIEETLAYYAFPEEQLERAAHRAKRPARRMYSRHPHPGAERLP